MGIFPNLSPRAKRRGLRNLDDLDDALGLMYFALKGMTREADDVLAARDLARSHHRILFVVARSDGVTIGDLHANLGVSLQALHRPLKQLIEKGYVAVRRDPARHRYKTVHLTDSGREIEHAASEAERRVMRGALERFGRDASLRWQEVMEAIAEHA